MSPTEASSTEHSTASAFHIPDLAGTLASEPKSERRGFTVDIASSVAAVERLRPSWSAWSHNLETDLDYFLHKVQNDPAILNPYVLAVYRNGEVQALLAGVVRRRRISTVVSFVPIQGPRAEVLEIIHGGRM